MQKTLMISLDTSILNPSSPAAERVRAYGDGGRLFILIPTRKKLSVRLSDAVRAEGTGGGKIVQFFRIVLRGRQLIHEQGIEEITTQDPFFTGLAGWLIGTGKKTILEVQLHGDFFSSGYYTKRRLGRFLVKRADRLRAAGERIRRSVIAIGVPDEKIVVRPIATDAAAIAVYAPRVNLREKYPECETIFLVLSRLDTVKNIPWLLEIFVDVQKTRPRAGLLIVGDGPEKERIEKTIRSFGLSDAVRMEPWTNDPWSYIKTADALLLPSISEGYGLSVMEAVAAGTSVIMTDVGVANYEVKPGPKVAIVPVNDKEQFKNAMQHI